MNNKSLVQLVTASFSILIAFVLISLSVIGNFSFSYCDFFVKDDNLYLGRDKYIDVYSGQNLINQIPVVNKYTSAYSFDLLPNDNIMVCYSTDVYIFDLQGNKIKQYSDTEMSMYNKLYRERKKSTDNEGNEYVMKSFLGRIRIEKIASEGDTSIIFKMPLATYLLKILKDVLIIYFIVSILNALLKFDFKIKKVYK